MSLPYVEGSVARSTDSEQRALTKIVDLLQGGGGGGGFSQVSQGSGVPVAPPTNPALSALYINTDDDVIFYWNVTNQAWE